MPSFSDSHRRAVQDVLAFVEQSIDAIEDILHGRRDDAIFLRLADDLSPKSAYIVRSRVHATQQELRQAKIRLGLAELREGKQRAIERRLMEAAGTLADLRPHRLQRLGELDDDQRRCIDEAIETLLKRLVEVRSCLDIQPGGGIAEDR